MNLRRYIKAGIFYLFLSAVLHLWGTDMTIFAALSAVLALGVVLGMRGGDNHIVPANHPPYSSPVFASSSTTYVPELGTPSTT